MSTVRAATSLRQRLMDAAKSKSAAKDADADDLTWYQRPVEYPSSNPRVPPAPCGRDRCRGGTLASVTAVQPLGSRAAAAASHATLSRVQVGAAASHSLLRRDYMGSPRRHLLWDWTGLAPAHICAGTGPTPARIRTGTG